VPSVESGPSLFETEADVMTWTLAKPLIVGLSAIAVFAYVFWKAG